MKYDKIVNMEQPIGSTVNFEILSYPIPSRIYVGIDNGVTGSIGIVNELGYSDFMKMPIMVELSYQKKKQMITRIDHSKLIKIFSKADEFRRLKIFLERPMVNPTRFKATVSALRALEATLVVLEQLDISRQYIDSKEWQKAMLPHGLKGDELKKASVNIGCRLFPQHKDFIKKHKDADGLLIAEYARKEKL